MRRTAAILILLALPALAQAQQPVAQTGATHTVRAGETLGSIAQIYFGSAAAWQRLYDANRDRILNPDRISPGLVIVLPGIAAREPAVTVTGFAVDGEPFAAHASRRELGQQRLLTARPAPPPSRERTLFYDVRSPEDIQPAVSFAPAEEITAVPRFTFQSAGWLDDGDPPIGEVVGFAGDEAFSFGKSTVHPYDDVRVMFSVPGTPEVGDRFLVYRVRRTVEGVGSILTPTGVLEVRRSDGAGVVARVVAEFDRIELGQLVTRIHPFPLEPGVHPVASEAGISGSLLVFQDRKELHLPGDLAFIDIGTTAGLRVGDQFSAFAGQGDGWDGREVARFQVVGTRARTATVRILTVESPQALAPGLRLHLDRRMP